MQKEVLPNSLTTCKRCGADIVFVPNPKGQNGHWVLDTARLDLWGCMTTPAFPVRTHIPAQYPDEKP